MEKLKISRPVVLMFYLIYNLRVDGNKFLFICFYCEILLVISKAGGI